jgi:hypothetical protein
VYTVRLLCENKNSLYNMKKQDMFRFARFFI